jgi:TldD protein
MGVEWKHLIKRLADRGAEYVDVRYVPKEENDTLVMWNGNLIAFDRAEERGYGVRVLVDGAWGFAASSCEEEAEAVFDRAFDNAAAASKRSRRPIRLADKDIVKARFESPCGIDPFEVPLLERVAIMKDIDSALQHKNVPQRVVSIKTTRKTIRYFDI